MGYDVHITRADHWAFSEEYPISAEEWLTTIAGDEDLTRTESAWADGIDARWNGPSEYTDPWFAWREGRIFTKHPDEPIVEKVSVMALHLGAMVQGDEGEIYVDHRHYERVYAIVRMEELRGLSHEIAVIKVLRSRAEADAEAARLTETTRDIGMTYIVEATRLEKGLEPTDDSH